MIHHLARAFHARERAAMIGSAVAAYTLSASPLADQARTPAPADTPNRHTPVRPRPITPWTAPRTVIALPNRVRISSDPADVRRTVIAGRLAEVCAALDRLVREQEATA